MGMAYRGPKGAGEDTSRPASPHSVLFADTAHSAARIRIGASGARLPVKIAPSCRLFLWKWRNAARYNHLTPLIHIRRGEQKIGERVCLPGGRGEAVCRFHKLRVRGSVPSFGRRRACDPYERQDQSRQDHGLSCSRLYQGSRKVTP